MTGWIIAGVAVALILIIFIVIYNGLVTLKNRADNGWANIDTQLQRRYDLIPNLVETVKGYAAHEKDLFEKIALARSGMMNAGSVSEKAQADNMLSGTLKSLFAVAEAYPQLKANENFKELQVELSNTENKISFARQFYNDTIAKYNMAIQKFPKNIIAGMLGFKQRDYFKAESEEARKAPKVTF